MIKIVENKCDIIQLWQEAFGDSVDDISFFIDNIKHGKCLGYYEDNKAVSMLYLIDCNYKSCTGSYVYAACTEKKSRGRGYMSLLLDYCKEHSENLCLIPANEGLIDYYKKQGLIVEANIEDISFDENDDICEYLFEGCELDKPMLLLYSKE